MRCTLISLVLAVTLPVAGIAQRPQTRNGFGISFGLGAGSATVSCHACAEYGGSGVLSYLRLGGYVRPDLLIAAETNSWYGGVFEGTITEYLHAILGVAQWYPNTSDGWYLKGGLGYSHIAQGAYTLPYPAHNLGTSGLGISLGAGYDWRLARNFALTPYVNYLWMAGGSFSDAEGTSGVTVGLLQLGVGFTWF